MHRIALAALLLIACGESETTEGHDEAPAGGTVEAPAADAPATEAPAAGTTAATSATKAALDEANTMVHPMQPWTDAEAKLKEKLGEPTKVEGDNYMWYAKDGETCHVLYVQKMGDSVGSAAVGTADCPA